MPGSMHTRTSHTGSIKMFLRVPKVRISCYNSANGKRQSGSSARPLYGQNSKAGPLGRI